MTAILLIVIGFYYMREAVLAGNLVLGGAIELCELVLPVILLCTGDPWRNVLVRLVFQLISLVFFYMEYALYELVLNKFISENWLDGLAEVSLGVQLINVAFTVVETWLTVKIVRRIVKRWKPEHKKIYTWIVLGYLVCGLIAGIPKVKDITEGGYDFGVAVLLLVVPAMLLAFLISAVYSKSEKERLVKENEWYEERIHALEESLDEPTDVQTVIRGKLKALEEAGIQVNCFDQFEKQSLPSDLEFLIDRIFAWIRQRNPEYADISFQCGGEMLLANVSLKGDYLSAVDPEEADREIETMCKRLGGAAVIDEASLSVMAFEMSLEGSKSA